MFLEFHQNCRFGVYEKINDYNFCDYKAYCHIVINECFAQTTNFMARFGEWVWILTLQCMFAR